jgi:hypothetical protein
VPQQRRAGQDAQAAYPALAARLQARRGATEQLNNNARAASGESGSSLQKGSIERAASERRRADEEDQIERDDDDDDDETRRDDEEDLTRRARAGSLLDSWLCRQEAGRVSEEASEETIVKVTMGEGVSGLTPTLTTVL